jgi:hypothetical protein
VEKQGLLERMCHFYPLLCSVLLRMDSAKGIDLFSCCHCLPLCI